MRDFGERLAHARTRLDPRWDAQQVESCLGRLHVRRRRRAALRTAALAAVLGLAFASPVLARWLDRSAPAPALVAALPRPAAAIARPLVLRDGSTATPLDRSSEIARLEERDARVTLELVSGRGRFEVVHDPTRLFRVRAGDVTVEDLGTVFVIERGPSGSRVVVESGRVRVQWQGGEATLGAGESGDFPRPTAPAIADAPLVRRMPASHAAESPRWNDLASSGDWDGAWSILAAAPPAAVVDEPEALLLAADAARLSGHPAQALPYLVRVVRDHRSDSRASLAAFTRGRVLLGSLGRPAEAAEAFADARTLSAGGSLAPDALAREVEAWHHAGRAELARARAEEYVRLYPDGSRLRSVRRFGGLDPE
jgi:transmembrane sensor